MALWQTWKGKGAPHDIKRFIVHRNTFSATRSNFVQFLIHALTVISTISVKITLKSFSFLHSSPYLLKTWPNSGRDCPQELVYPWSPWASNCLLLYQVPFLFSELPLPTLWQRWKSISMYYLNNIGHYVHDKCPPPT